MSEDTVAAAAASGPVDVVESFDAIRRRPAKVLLAASDPTLAADLATILTGAGFVVTGRAGDGAQAVALASELGPDLVVLDVAVPGLTAAGPISGQDIPVILLMEPSEGTLVQQAVAAGAMAWLVKPIVPPSLVATAEMVLARHAEKAALRRSALQVRSRIDEHKVVERAKGLLMARHHVTESVATDWMRQTAEDTGTSLARVAGAIVEQWASGTTNRAGSPRGRRRADTPAVTGAVAPPPPVDLEVQRARRLSNPPGRVQHA